MSFSFIGLYHGVIRMEVSVPDGSWLGSTVPEKSQGIGGGPTVTFVVPDGSTRL